MQTIIFSKDRTSQLELLLRSIKDHWKDHHNITVLYRASNNKFQEGYNLVKTIHPEFTYKEEKSFKQDLLDTLDTNFYKMFLVDDIVFIRPFSLQEPEVKLFETKTDIITLSLRLSPRINYCYTQKKSCTPPAFNSDGTWDWKRPTNFISDWEYPLSLDGHILRTCDIYHLLFNGAYKAPNTLEGFLDSKSRENPRNLMLCFKESKIVNIPVNRVQSENQNHAGTQHYFGNDFLNDLFLSGKRISTQNIYGIHPNSPHYEIPFMF